MPIKDSDWNLGGTGFHTRSFGLCRITTPLPKMEPAPTVCWYCGDDLRPITWTGTRYSSTGLVCVGEFCGATWVPKLVQGKWTKRKTVASI